jgi:anti-sigma B factor antagonist
MEPDGNEAVIALTGEIDLHEAPAVAAKIAETVEKRPPQVVIDLSGVEYMDSSGLGVLIEALRKIQGYGGQLALRHPQPAVLKVLEITKLTHVFKIV